MNIESKTTKFNPEDLISLFDQCFLTTENTRLVRGGQEPIYLPVGFTDLGIRPQPYAQIVFAHGYFTSALHEIAHWCLAGEARRKQVDYGYWYAPDGRTAEQQAKFQQVEIKPQAIEMAFSLACGIKFNVSCDNLAGDEFGRQPDHRAFAKQVETQHQIYRQTGFPSRAQAFIDALSQFYRSPQLPTLAASNCASRFTADNSVMAGESFNAGN